ncbi:bacteriohemerythrin [Sulfuricurvum sp.]|uniref:bacteriohemerythrin n=1 Tax=Sulfuricurvum sp. TaxID=2025608 RepID=UPI00261C9266|nr:bacteriohemerythrin [Sulfuricurvum sp.]MDD2267311.1 bacteriohemerythrin [Sulfuricurvum sp.]MDD2783933.1 bacteriohemerythrin [Sulfuricurvum sp.]
METIDIFPWDDHFNTGLSQVDEQHRRLVDLLNKLARGVAFKSDLSLLNKIFDELLDYTVYHFETEEKIWARYLLDDPMESQHKKVHQKFIDTVLRLKSERLERSNFEIAEETLGFLARWLASHILETDRMMAYIVLDLENGSTLEDAKQSANEKMSGFTRTLIDMILSIYETLSTNTLQLMYEIRNHKVLDDKVKQQSMFQDFLLDLSSSFINLSLEHMDSAIYSALERLALFVKADRAYIFDYDFEKRTMSNTYEWCNEGISPQISILQNEAIDMYPEWVEPHLQGKPIHIKDVSKMPKGNVRTSLESQEIKSIITLPRIHNNRCLGYIGFDAVRRIHPFNQGEIRLLKLFVTLLEHLEDRMRDESELFESKNLLMTIINTMPIRIFWKDTQSRYLGCNTLFALDSGLMEPSQLIGKDDYQMGWSAQAELYRSDDMNVMESGKARLFYEEPQTTPDGKTIWLSTSKVPLRDHTDKIIGVVGAYEDITVRKEAESNLRLAANVFSHAREGIMITTKDGTIVDVNEAFTQITGYSRDEIIGIKPSKLKSGRQSKEFYKKMWNSMLSEGHWNGELWNRRKSGEIYPQLLTISSIRDKEGEIQNFVSLFSDITTFKEHEQQLEHIAHYDSLTGLANRVLFGDRLEQAMIQTNRHGKHLAVTYLDLDGFKEINDLYGHEAGDKVLMAVAANMKRTLREGDTLSRLGGDEFVAILHDLPDPDASIPTLERLLNAASQPIQIDQLVLEVSASLGATFYPQIQDIQADQLLRQADQAMYQAKQAGKNRFHLFDIEHDQNIRIHNEHLEEIKSALHTNEFCLFYQPKVNMRTGEIIGVEALIRWEHSTKGLLSPAEFLPIIETHPLAVSVGEWVIESALQQIQSWSEEGLSIPISVNIGARQLQQSDFIERLQSLLHAYPNTPPSMLELEILETSALEDIVHISKVIEECKMLGVTFALDDFGTGYSSLRYLKHLPISVLKIDQSFVRNMHQDQDDLAIIAGVIGLGKAFKREIIAEGVETIQQGELLIQMGCERAQGYAIARPMPPKQLLEWSHTWIPGAEWKGKPASHC